MQEVYPYIRTNGCVGESIAETWLVSTDSMVSFVLYVHPARYGNSINTVPCKLSMVSVQWFALSILKAAEEVQTKSRFGKAVYQEKLQLFFYPASSNLNYYN